MDHVRLAVVDHLLLCHVAVQVTERIDMVVVPDLPQHPKTFSLHRATSAVPENRAFVRIVDVAVVPHNAFASVHDRFDTAYAEDDIVLGLELVVEVHYEEVYFAAAFASATALVIAASAVIAELADKAMEHSVVEVVASAVVH